MSCKCDSRTDVDDAGKASDSESQKAQLLDGPNE